MRKWIIAMFCSLFILTLFVAGCKSSPEEPKVETPPVTETKKDVPPAPAEEKVEPVIDKAAEKEAALRAENDKLIKEAYDARERAIKAGADKSLSNEFGVVDVTSREAQVVYENGGDPAVFNKAVKDNIYRYKALERAGEGYTALRKIEDNKLQSYATKEYENGIRDTKAAEKLFNSGASGQELYEVVERGTSAFETVVQKAYTEKSEKLRDEVLVLKEKADKVKANVADKDGYNTAIAFYTRANQDLLEGKSEEAYQKFVQCEALVKGVYEKVLEKRSKAEEAIARAKKRLTDANSVAEKADTIVPFEKAQELGDEADAHFEEAQ